MTREEAEAYGREAMKLGPTDPLKVFIVKAREEVEEPDDLIIEEGQTRGEREGGRAPLFHFVLGSVGSNELLLWWFAEDS